MKTSWLRNIAIVMMLAMSASMQVYAQTPDPAQQVALDALYNALPDDTITLSYSNDSKTYYFLSANGTGVQGATAVEGKLALWKVQKENNYGFRLQNVGNEKWLLIEQGKGQSTTFKYVDAYQLSTVLYVTNPKEPYAYPTKGRGYASVYYGASDRYYLFYDGNKNTWTAKNGEKNPLRIERWSQHDSAWLVIEPDHDIITFPFVREGNGNSQPQNLTYTTKKWTES